MEVTLFLWSYCWDMKKIISKSGISLNAGTLNRGFYCDEKLVDDYADTNCKTRILFRAMQVTKYATGICLTTM